MKDEYTVDPEMKTYLTIISMLGRTFYGPGSLTPYWSSLVTTSLVTSLPGGCVHSSLSIPVTQANSLPSFDYDQWSDLLCYVMVIYWSSFVIVYIQVDKWPWYRGSQRLIIKIAQSPFRAWLLQAIAAPTPIPSLAHSTSVTSGVNWVVCWSIAKMRKIEMRVSF